VCSGFVSYLYVSVFDESGGKQRLGAVCALCGWVSLIAANLVCVCIQSHKSWMQLLGNLSDNQTERIKFSCRH